MCGIFGIYNSDPTFDWGLLEKGRDAMISRGPDDAGAWRSGPLGLAHRRLSILDLTPGGHQPMLALEGRVVIVFNGEIYNHDELRLELVQRGFSFRTASDTEVLINAYLEWGTECLSRLNGMFAFAIYDQRQEAIFLARDRAGEKPLFYYQDGKSFRIASELKALLTDTQLPRQIRHDALDCYLMMGYVPGDMCILDGFHKLAAAHAMVFDLKTHTSRTWRYWKLPDLAEPALSPGDLHTEFESLLDTAVRRQLAADVPVGVLLSGGVDSSLITAFAARHCRDLKTFTVAFPDQPSFDETAHSQLIARHFGTNHSIIEARNQSAALVPILARQFDEPVADSSMIPTFLVTEAVRQHCTVALGGDGGDELFGGYKNYGKALQVDKLKNNLPDLLLPLIASAASTLLPFGMRGRTWLQYLGRAPNVTILAPHFETALRRSLMSRHAPWNLNAEKFCNFPVDSTSDLLQRLTRADFYGFLPEDILAKVDRASMLNSLEVRSPLLDHQIIEFAFKRLPSALKVNLKGRKIFLKSFAAGHLPPRFDMQRKQGLTMPIGEWLKKGDFRELFQEVLYDRECLFDRDVIEKMFSGLNHGRAHGERLYALALFELWRRTYKVSF
jgi:asparagine synthase (glutamine-hydrolysing)